MLNERERYEQEIRVIEALLRCGHPDMEGLCLALSDWSDELAVVESLPDRNSE